jgi:uncharacterized repeat protein (TIGR03837 family)
MAAMQPQWDIFCRVIDNFGDIGICWRLARQLAVEHDLAVRLWVDDMASLALLCRGVDAGQDSQVAAGVEIRRWRDDVAVDRLGDVIIEAFGCGLPPTCLDSMAASSPPPCWINLEYLSAESWAEGCHGMASPHPSLPLVKYFYFPGFSPASGGLPRERGLLAARAAAQLARQSDARLEVSLFCYETAPVGELLDSLAASPRPVTCHVPPGKPLAAVSAHLGSAGPWQIGNLRVEPIAFLAQDDYDRLLWRCDINFVRGEDSFVRAQWAGQPFVWQPYVQTEDTHLVKLEAFLARYAAGMDAESRAAVTAMFRAWNGGADVAAAWPAFLARGPQLTEHTREWAARLAEQPDFASSLVNFCASKV